MKHHNSVKDGRTAIYYVENGFLAEEAWFENGLPFKMIRWNFDGTVQLQKWLDENGKQQQRESPPWLGNVTDQTEPTAPWWKGGER